MQLGYSVDEALLVKDRPRGKEAAALVTGIFEAYSGPTIIPSIPSSSGALEG